MWLTLHHRAAIWSCCAVLVLLAVAIGLTVFFVYPREPTVKEEGADIKTFLVSEESLEFNVTVCLSRDLCTKELSWNCQQFLQATLRTQKRTKTKHNEPQQISYVCGGNCGGIGMGRSKEP